MPPGSEALHLFGLAALVLGLLLLCVGRAAMARGLLLGQVAAAALGAASLALAQNSALLGIAVLVLILGHGALALRSPVPAAAVRPVWPLVGAVTVGMLTLALPQAALLPREAVAIGIGTALLGVVASCRAGWQGPGALACGNGVALAALMLGDAETALAGVVLSLGGAACAAIAWPRAEIRVIAFPAGLDAVLAALLGAGVLAVLRNGRAGRWIAILVPLLCLALLGRQAWAGLAGPDRASLLLAILAAFVALTDAVADPPGRAEAAWRAGMLAGLLLATMADNIFLTWLGGLATACCLSRGRSGALPILLMLGLLGTILLALAARPALGAGLAALNWSALLQAGGRCNFALLGLAFAFLVVGYGGIAGLAPLHGWMRGSEAVTLAVPFGNVGLLVLLRLRLVLAQNGAAIGAGPPLIVLGLISILLAGVAAWRRGETGRLLGCIGLGQAGLVALAFGLGGAAGISAGILQMALRTLSFTACRHALRPARQRGAAVAAGAALVTAAGLPPSGGFAGLFLVATATLARAPLLAVPLAAGVIAWILGLLAAFHLLRSAAPGPVAAPGRAAVAVVWVHVGLALLLGLLLPGALSAWVLAR